MNRVIVGRRFSFEAAHQLPNEDKYGKCSKLHGHRYELEIEFIGEISKEGWVVNFTDIKSIIQKEVIEIFDHSFLNDFIEIPTVENLALRIRDILLSKFNLSGCELLRLKIYETRDCYAILELL